MLGSLIDPDLEEEKKNSFVKAIRGIMRKCDYGLGFKHSGKMVNLMVLRNGNDNGSEECPCS